MRLLLAAASLVVVLALPAGAGAERTTLFGTVGPGFTISLKDAAGNAVTQLAPGNYMFQIDDKAAIHNFHLTGPGGVDMSTGVDEVGTVTWTVELVAGTYHFQCDPHATTMKGDFTVAGGTTTTTTTPPVTTPAPPAPASALRLAATVRANGTVALTRAGAPVASAKPGPVVIVVADRSKKASFHLVGPGVNRSTSAAGTGTVTWRLTLKRGVYKYGSGATASLRRSLRVG